MDAADFGGLLDRFGGDFSRWPAELRVEAEELLSGSTQARAAMATMERLELGLRGRATPIAAPFAAVAVKHGQDRSSILPARSARWGATAAAMLLLGLAVGILQTDKHDDKSDEVVWSATETTGAVDVD